MIRGHERGSALTATLAATAVLLPLAAFAALLARVNFYVQENTRAQAEVFYVAESGAEHALAELPPAATLDDLLAGPDGLTGTGDDGAFPFRSTIDLLRGPLRYTARVERVTDTLVRLTSTADGRRNARAVVEVLIGRDPAPFVPAALYAVNEVSLRVSDDTLVSGFDHAPGDAPDRPTGSGAAIPAVGVGAEDGAGGVRAQLTAGERERLVGKGENPSVSGVESIAIDLLIEQLAATGNAVRISGNALPAGAQLGTPAAPQITVLLDTMEIPGAVTGAGVLIAHGELHVTGSLAFEGLILTRGGVVVSEVGSLDVTGSLWAANARADISLGGHGAIVYGRDAMAGIDRWLAGRLPHALVAQSWREVL
jgi:hypothetical protein